MNKIYSLFFALLLLAAQLLPAQGRIVLSNNAYIVLDNAVQLVIGNPNPNAITLGTGGGNFVSESENDLILWAIGPRTGNYAIPWITAANFQIPLAVNLISAGTGAGFFRFSTHSDNDLVNTWNNFDYRPSDVTNMGGASIPNNSASVIDRFWRIEHLGYTTSPQAMISFGYADQERTNPGNIIPAGSMFAQQFDSGQGRWLLPGSGTDNFPTPTVTNADASTNFFKSWTLSTQTVPLPSSDLQLQAAPEEGAVRLNWSISFSAIGDHFVIERSSDGIAFADLLEVARVPGSFVYKTSDDAPLPGQSHYRVRLVDPNGQAQYSEVRSIFIGLAQVRVVPNPVDAGNLVLWAEGLRGLHLHLELTDLTGRQLFQRKIKIHRETQRLAIQPNAPLSAGIYLLKVKGEAGWTRTIRVMVQ